MNRIHKQRLVMIVIGLIGFGGAITLLLFALKANLNHFFTPSDILRDQVRVGQSIRVGGLVKQDSVVRSKDSLEVRFLVTDNVSDVVVSYTGILPDLFREGQGIVVTGKLDDNGQVIASEVLAKHDENYMPPEAMEAIRRAGHPAQQQP